MKAPVCQVLLATCNGEAYLPDLLASLACQTFRDWQLLVRDDGSLDQTLAVLRQWQGRFAYPVMLLPDHEPVGSTRSFSRLVAASSAPYLLFCDQDDVWLPEKITLQYQTMQQLETVYGIQTPLLVHSDLCVVDHALHLQHASFWHYRDFDVYQPAQAYVLDNVVTGCASLFNRAAAVLAFPVPRAAMQHDRWLALVCALRGHVEPLPGVLVKYRQHATNQLGSRPGGIHALENRVRAWAAQADACLQRHGRELQLPDRRWLGAVAALADARGWQRRRHLWHHGIYKRSFRANLALWLMA